MASSMEINVKTEFWYNPKLMNLIKRRDDNCFGLRFKLSSFIDNKQQFD